MGSCVRTTTRGQPPLHGLGHVLADAHEGVGPLPFHLWRQHFDVDARQVVGGSGLRPVGFARVWAVTSVCAGVAGGGGAVGLSAAPSPSNMCSIDIVS